MPLCRGLWSWTGLGSTPGLVTACCVIMGKSAHLSDLMFVTCEIGMTLIPVSKAAGPEVEGGVCCHQFSLGHTWISKPVCPSTCSTRAGIFLGAASHNKGSLIRSWL